jgi:glycosyltransferase involved in cell wall biosynthesis
MRVCYFGTYRQEYSRNQIMIEGLRRASVEVIECHEPLWQGIEDRVRAASGGWFRLAFFVRVLRAYFNLLRHYRAAGHYDIMVVGYPGQFDVFLARLLTWLRRKPLVWDIFMSIYLIDLERGLDRQSHFTTGLLRRLEMIACRLPDQLILDTSEYVTWFGKVHGIPPERFRLVPTGADDRVFHRLEVYPKEDGFFHVMYYGTFIPNHGIRIIIEAAHLLADDPSIRFEMIGDGPDYEVAQALAHKYRLANVYFCRWMEKSDLIQRVARADVCLGAFGTTPQSLMTVQNMIYEGLAMAKPVITGDSPAVRLAFTHKKHIFLCLREDPSALGESIRTLKRDPQLLKSLGENGYRLFREKFNLFHIGQVFSQHLQTLIAERK